MSPTHTDTRHTRHNQRSDLLGNFAKFTFYGNIRFWRGSKVGRVGGGWWAVVFVLLLLNTTRLTHAECGQTPDLM